VKILNINIHVGRRAINVNIGLICYFLTDCLGREEIRKFFFFFLEGKIIEINSFWTRRSQKKSLRSCAYADDLSLLMDF
jgi:hypothetical protein